MAHLVRAIPMFIVGWLLSTALEAVGLLERSQMAALDATLLVVNPTPVNEIMLVEIDDHDYTDMFAGRSPLAAAPLARVIRAIQDGGARLVAVDITTSHPDQAELTTMLGCAPPIVWAQDLELLDSGPLLRPLAHAAGRPPCATASPVVPVDEDGVVRRYTQTTLVGGKPLPTLPWVISHFDRRGSEAPNPDNEERIINFAGDRYTFSTFTARQILQAAAADGWKTSRPLANRIVILGGTYGTARDRHPTPLGEMSGLNLMAQAVATELRGGGVTPAREWMKFAVDVILGIGLVAVNFWFSPLIGLLTSLVIVPVGSMLGSFFVFSTLGFWFSFVPILASVAVDQTVDHVREVGHLRKRVIALENEIARIRRESSRKSKSRSYVDR